MPINRLKVKGEYCSAIVTQDIEKCEKGLPKVPLQPLKIEGIEKKYVEGGAKMAIFQLISEGQFSRGTLTIIKKYSCRHILSRCILCAFGSA